MPLTGESEPTRPGGTMAAVRAQVGGMDVGHRYRCRLVPLRHAKALSMSRRNTVHSPAREKRCEAAISRSAARMARRRRAAYAFLVTGVGIDSPSSASVM